MSLFVQLVHGILEHWNKWLQVNYCDNYCYLMWCVFIVLKVMDASSHAHAGVTGNAPYELFIAVS